jgi:hypothetical protein
MNNVTLEELRNEYPDKNIRVVMWYKFCPGAAEEPLYNYMLWIQGMWRIYFAEVYNGKEQFATGATFAEYHAAFDAWLYQHLARRQSAPGGAPYAE